MHVWRDGAAPETAEPDGASAVMKVPFVSSRETVGAVTREVTKYAWLIPALVFLIAFSVRAAHTSKGLPYIHHHDEPFVANTALNMLKTGDLNPHYYNYGSLMLYLNVGVDLLHYAKLMGQPYGDKPFMANLRDINTTSEDAYRWTNSHPSFYHWNRLLTSMFGAGTVVLVFLMARAIFLNRWVALVPALFLALLPLHIEHSAFATVDVPSGFFFLGSAYFALMYMRLPRASWLVWSLIFVACAAATKYNAAICMIMPVLAMAWQQCTSREKPRPLHWLLLVLVPPVTFLILMPYALLDFSSFATAIGYEIRHYKVMGHGKYSREPGLDQLLFQLGEFWTYLGPVPALLAILGLAGALWRPRLRFVLILPMVGMAFMAQMTINFHRNLLLFYPFIALMIVAGLWMVYRFPGVLPEGLRDRAQRIVSVGVWGGTMLYLVIMAAHSASEARAATLHVETRSAAISAVNKLSDIRAVVIAPELRIHESDLRRLRYPRIMVPLDHIVQYEPESADVIYIVPTGIVATGTELDEALAQAQLSRVDLAGVFRDGVVSEISGADLYLNDLNMDPGIILYRPPAARIVPKPVAPRFQVSVDAEDRLIEFRDQYWQAKVSPGKPFQTMLYALTPTAHSFSFDWTMSDTLSPPAKLEIVLLNASEDVEITKNISEVRKIPFLDGDTMNRVFMKVTPRVPGPLVAVISARNRSKLDSDRVTASVYIKNIELSEK